MKKFFLAALLALLPVGVMAQTVTPIPSLVKSRTSADLGNGPMEIKLLQGSMGVFSSQGSGVGSTSGSSTTLTLTATPTTPPCVGCVISGNGITPGTTVTAYSGTSVTMSAAMTVPASTPVAFGAACPTTALNAPPQILLQASVATDIPLYTYARICAAGHLGADGQFVTFPIGAH